MSTVRSLCALLVVACLCGCGGGRETSHSPATHVDMANKGRSSDGLSGAVGDGIETAEPRSLADSDRMIVHTADVALTTVDFGPLPDRIAHLTQSLGGYVSESDIQGASGQPRSGRWTLRVPVARYSELLHSTIGLGVLVTQSEHADEVTAEYQDLEARLRAKQEEATRLTRHLHEDAKTLDQILMIEREIQRVTTEIEQLTGRRQLLANLSSLSTIRLQIAEVLPYHPEQTPTFMSLVEQTWTGSVTRLKQVGQSLTLTFVGLAPWLAVLALPTGLLLRRLRRNVKSRVVGSRSG